MMMQASCLDLLMLIFGRAMKRPVGILHVKVLRAMKLKKKDLLGASDPYVKLKLTEDKLPSKKTTVKHRNLHPEWNEEFKVVVKDPESQALEMTVYDWEQVCFFRFVFGKSWCLQGHPYLWSILPFCLNMWQTVQSLPTIWYNFCISIYAVNRN